MPPKNATAATTAALIQRSGNTKKPISRPARSARRRITTEQEAVAGREAARLARREVQAAGNPAGHHAALVSQPGQRTKTNVARKLTATPRACGAPRRSAAAPLSQPGESDSASVYTLLPMPQCPVAWNSIAWAALPPFHKRS